MSPHCIIKQNISFPHQETPEQQKWHTVQRVWDALKIINIINSSQDVFVKVKNKPSCSIRHHIMTPLRCQSRGQRSAIDWRWKKSISRTINYLDPLMTPLRPEVITLLGSATLFLLRSNFLSVCRMWCLRSSMILLQKYKWFTLKRVIIDSHYSPFV